MGGGGIVFSFDSFIAWYWQPPPKSYSAPLEFLTLQNISLKWEHDFKFKLKNSGKRVTYHLCEQPKGFLT